MSRVSKQTLGRQCILSITQNRQVTALYITEEEKLIRHLKEEPLQRVYLLCGSELYLKELYAEKIQQKALSGGSGMEDFNLHKFDGRNLKCDQLADAAEALPLMSSVSCLVIRDLEIDKMAAGELQKLKDLLKDPPETSILLFVMLTASFDLKKSAKCKAIQKLIDPIGWIVEFSGREKRNLYKFASAKAAETDSSLSKEAFAHLLERCSSNMMNLSHEMEKLSSYAAGREITFEDIDSCTCATIDTTVFELSKAILKNDYSRAMNILGDLIDLREQPVAIVGAIAASFLDLYRAKLASRSQRGQADILKAFDYKGKDFRVKNAMREVSKCSTSFLKGSISLLLKADLDLKSSRVEDVILLERLITELFLLRQKEGRNID